MSRPGLTERIGLLEKTIELTRSAAPALPIWVGGRHPRVRRVGGVRGQTVGTPGEPPPTSSPREPRGAARRGRQANRRHLGRRGDVRPRSELSRRCRGRQGRPRGARCRPALTAGTPAPCVDHLAALATVADELVVSVLPNVPETGSSRKEVLCSSDLAVFGNGARLFGLVIWTTEPLGRLARDGVPPHRTPPSVRVRSRQRAEAGRPPGGGGHHRSRVSGIPTSLRRRPLSKSSSRRHRTRRIIAIPSAGASPTCARRPPIDTAAGSASSSTPTPR